MNSFYRLFRSVSAFIARDFLRYAGVAACLLLIVGVISAADAQTAINIGTTVKQSGAKRFGINLANEDFYDSGMLLRNLTFRNPGFEGQTWTTILQCQVASATLCQDVNPYSTWAANFMQGATFTFMTGPAAGETGTVTTQDVAVYPPTNTGVVLHFSALPTAPVSGDIVQVRKTFPGGAQDGAFILNQNGAVLSTDSNPADQAPGTTGTQCLQITESGGQSVTVAQLFDTTAGRSFLQLNGSYTVSFKARSLGGTNNFNLQVVRLQSPTQINYLNQNVVLTNQWATYSYTFNTAETGSALGGVEVALNFAGNNLLLDDLQMSPTANTYGTAYRDEVVSTLLALKPGVIRYMDTAQGLGSSFDNMLKDQFGRQRAGWSEEAMELDSVPVGLYEFLKLCQVVGAEPWWTMPTAMNQTELQHVMEYMAGDSTTTYGAIRAAQGQTAPWTTVFPVIHLELGNEVWNGGSFAGETIVSPDRFGQWANTVFTAAKSTSYYTSNPNSFDLVIGTIEVNEFWTQYELDNCPACDTLAVAAYMFGTFDDSSSTEAIFGPLMAYPQWLDGPNTSNDNNHMWRQAQVAAGINLPDQVGTKYPAPVAIYETNLGTNSGTASQAVVNSTVAGVGAGIASANHMLMMLRDLGVKTQNMFALSEYTNGFYGSGGSNATTTPLWGTVIDMGVTNLKRPQFLAEQLSNTAILPTVLTTTQSGDNPTWNQPLSSNDNVQLNNVNYIQSYAFTDGTHNNLIVFNLHRTASLPVTFTGANAPTGSVLIRQLTSGTITDTNEVVTKVYAVDRNVDDATTGTTYTLPPFSMTVFLSPGAALPSASTTLTASPKNTSAHQPVTLTATISATATPTGTVRFLDGSTSLGTATLDANGVATFPTSFYAGSHSITAAYSGDGASGSSTSSSVTLSIASSTSTSLQATPTSAASGVTVSFSATVTPKSGSMPSGSVMFLDGTTTIGSGTLDGSGVASFSTSTLNFGTHTISAVYQGTTKNHPSTSNALTETIGSGSDMSEDSASGGRASQIE